MYKITCVLTGNCIDVSKELFDLLKNEKEDSFKRRSRLYIPLNREKYILKSESAGADGLIFDLEDSVPPRYKSEARSNIRKIPEKKKHIEYILRINGHQTGLWEEDIKFLENYPFDSVMIPKVESPKQIENISSRLPRSGIRRIVLIETIQGLWNVRQIAEVLTAGDAMGYGAGDLSTSFGIPRKPINECIILQQAFMQVLFAAKALDIDVFDPPYRDYSDITTLKREARFGRDCGTVGKQAIHPSQLEAINSIYSPSDEEISGYISELTGFANKRDTNAISLNGAYRGKPSRTLAERKLLDFVRQGYINLECEANSISKLPLYRFG